MSYVYSEIAEIPSGHASDRLTEGCLVLEGGAFRGLYTGGVLDRLMEADINFQTTVGVSAGAMNGFNYVSGQIGRASRFNLTYRHDSRYVGWRALLADKGLFGFDFVFRSDGRVAEPFDSRTFYDPKRRFIAVATNCNTGEPEYFEKGVCKDMAQAIRASASMPMVSKMVPVEGIPCLDGGCSDAIPIRWALDQGFDRIVVVRTRDRSYRKTANSLRTDRMLRTLYRKYPAFYNSVAESNARYGEVCDELDALEKEDRIFVLAPEHPVEVGRLEPDMEKLGALYYEGYWDADRHLEELRQYLGRH